VLGVLFVLFVSIFAFDVFSEDYTVTETAVALLIHLVPSYLLIAALWIAWKREVVGGIIYIFLGLFYIWMVTPDANIYAILFISGPAFLLGGLFLLNKLLKSGT